MAATTEALAAAVGAPFLRADFFVGSPTMGVRLNEVAYGCGVDYKTRSENGQIADDAPAIAQILQEGMALCQSKLSPDNFLSKLGARGRCYSELEVAPVPPEQRLQASPSGGGLRLGDEVDDCALGCIVPEEMCHTPRRSQSLSAFRASGPLFPRRHLEQPPSRASNRPRCHSRGSDSRSLSFGVCRGRM